MSILILALLLLTPSTECSLSECFEPQEESDDLRIRLATEVVDSISPLAENGEHNLGLGLTGSACMDLSGDEGPYMCFGGRYWFAQLGKHSNAIHSLMMRTELVFKISAGSPFFSATIAFAAGGSLMPSSRELSSSIGGDSGFEFGSEIVRWRISGVCTWSQTDKSPHYCGPAMGVQIQI